ncbi:zinc ribbon domain-containing protein, partial [Actinomadura logoneensis]
MTAVPPGQAPGTAPGSAFGSAFGSASGSASGSLIACPGCGYPAHPDDQFCESCGRPHPARAPREPGSSSAKAARCVDCGSTSIAEDGFCDRCGLRQPTGREHVEDVLTAPDGRVAAAGVSDVGRRRRRNEDAFALAAHPAAVCAVVCDGVATAPGSDQASRVAAETGAAALAR